MNLPLSSYLKFKKLAGQCFILPALLLLVARAIGKIMYNLPAVIQPSPQSTAYARYRDCPMVRQTALTDITIPLHSITVRRLSVPIIISFHASGGMADKRYYYYFSGPPVNGS
jgi:hypothetical protein